MKIQAKILLTTAMTVVAIMVLTAFDTARTAEVEAVKKVVLESYINGAFNELNAAEMENGFHKDFSIYTAKGEEISKYPIDKWIEGVKKRRNDGYDPKDPENVWEHTFAILDVTGGAAQVKVELSNQGKLVYTDYLSLLKFESGWKIVAKVYHKHS